MEAAKDVFAGTFAGATGVVIGQPLDVLRIRAQTTWAAKQGSITHNILGMLRQEGVLSMYKGIVPPMLGVGAQHAALFLAYGSVVRYLSGPREENTPSLAVIAAAGCVGGAFSSLVTAPVELLKVRQQVEEARGGARMVTIFKDIVSREGVFGFMSKGLAATIIREIPAYSTFFVSYEFIQRKWAKARGVELNEVPLSVLFLAGGFSGALSWLPSYPFDVIKSRLQTAGEGSGSETFLNCARRIHAKEGFQAFFRGFLLTIVRSFPADGAILVTYTFILRQLSSLQRSTNRKPI